MKITINVNDRHMRELQKSVGDVKPDVITKEALSLFQWAVEEVRKGKRIVSFDEKSEAFREPYSSLLNQK